MRLRLAAAIVLPVGIVAAQQPAPARHAFTPADWYKVITLSAPALSPDGKQVAFTVTTVREAENRRHSEVWVVGTQGGEPMRYTSPGFESSAPRFSDDGKILYSRRNVRADAERIGRFAWINRPARRFSPIDRPSSSRVHSRLIRVLLSSPKGVGAVVQEDGAVEAVAVAVANPSPTPRQRIRMIRSPECSRWHVRHTTRSPSPRIRRASTDVRLRK